MMHSTPAFVALIGAMVWGTGQSYVEEGPRRGPSFLMEPPPRLEFSNSSGGRLDCTASGLPQPTVTWQGLDGSTIGDVPGVRRVLSNGTLLMLAFPPELYRQDVHSNVYRCTATNNVGSIISRDVHVRAVVTQSYKVSVQVQRVAQGCTAVLQCIVDRSARDMVKVVGWLQEPSFYIYPSLQGDGKYHVLPSGELLVNNVEYSDTHATYRCRTRHKLTKMLESSQPASIRITDTRAQSSPMMLEHQMIVSVHQDEGAVLVCISVGCPQPDYRWFHVVGGYESTPVIAGPRKRILGPILAIEAVTEEDAGLYKCSSSNAAGEASADIRLHVATPLSVEISPQVSTVRLGATAEFRCSVSQGSGAHLITWFKNGRVLPGRSNGELLVLNGITREDQGMYQCVVRRAEGDTAQASGELQLGDAAPVLMYSFIEQTLQPGPAVSLKCTASGNPTPHITWKLDGYNFNHNSRYVVGQYVTVHGDVISHVNISHVIVEDGGEYSCIAENRAGKAAHSARLNVYGLPYIRQIPKVTAVAGEEFQIKCPVAGYPIEEIKWEKGGRELPEDLRQKVVPGQGLLVISNVQKATDAGVYTCTARNKQGQTARRSGEITVIVPPKISPFSTDRTLHLGERASLTCSVTKGDAPLTVTWLKDGKPLDPKHHLAVQQVDQFNSILLIESLSPEHNGNYSCVARNPAAEVVHTQRLVVNVPPVIEGFTFPVDGLPEGARTRAVCGVSSGDPPLSITWLKDGIAIPQDLPVNISTLDMYSSLLSISSLESSHSGEYTCVASNPASEARYSSKLQVKVPPRWTLEPLDTSVERGRHAIVDCQAQGVPTPSVQWKKATGSKSGDYEDVRDRLYTKLFANGSLLLQNVKEDREGFYLCQAHNGIGNGIGKVILLKVNSAPYFSGQSRSVNVKKGDTAVLVCHIHGDTPISVRWLHKGKTPLTRATNYRVNPRQEVTPEGTVMAELSIGNVEASDSGSYFCQATNMYGRDQQLVQLTVQEPPEKPSELKAVMINSRSVNLQWAHQTGDPTDVTKYIVQYKEVSAAMWKQVELSGQLRGALIEGLKPATKYIMRVAAEGPAGRSGTSSELLVTTEPQRPAGPPLGLTVRPLSSSKLHVSWQPPLPELRHGEIQGYYVGYKEISMLNGNYNMTAVTADGDEGAGELVLGDLAKYTRYTIVVQAFNQVGHGPLSEPMSAQTMEDVPSAPPDALRCTALSSQSLQVMWQPPPAPHCNGIIQGYKLQYDTHDPEIDVGLETRKTTALSLILSGLQRYTNYTMQVLAFTRVGDGPYSKITFCHTDEDAPGPPGDIKVVSSTTQSLLVSWLPPSHPNGVVTKYTLYTRVMDGASELNHGKRNIPAVQTSYESKNLQHHIEYQFWVTASTRVGEGTSTSVVSMLPSARVPARVSSFGQVIKKPWHETVALPCVMVGSPTPKRQWHKKVLFKSNIFPMNLDQKQRAYLDSSYVNNQSKVTLFCGRLYAARNGTSTVKDSQVQPRANNNLQILDTGELVISDLTRADSDNYTCQVENSVGTDVITYHIVVQVPPSPPFLYVTSATSHSVLLHWKQGDDGAAQILGYSLYYKKSHGENEEISLSRRTTSYELKGLQCGSTYSISLSSYNKLGSSLPSQSLPVRTQGQMPGTPAPSAFLQPNSSSVTLKLHVWPDNGCPLLLFTVRYKSINDLEWILVSNNVKPQKKFVVTGLLSSMEYNLQVEATNIAGSSVGEFQFYTLTKDGELPPPELVRRGHYSRSFYTDVRVMAPLIVAIVSLFIAAATIVFCHRTRQARSMKETLDNQQNAEAQRERYYATIHKAAMQQSNDKIPETSEDISPYATFQLTDPNSTLLHSFMYHEQAMQEQGCASVPPQSMRSAQPKGRRARRRSSRKTDAETDESDSDPDQITSSRTESSNHLDATVKARYIYQAAHSSTSSDISPMSEVKSLPRRGGRARLSTPGKLPMRQSLSIAETAFRGPPDRPEMSEAECDIDTIKKLKLGIRSSLWTRPSPQNPHSDYSIAV